MWLACCATGNCFSCLFFSLFFFLFSGIRYSIIEVKKERLVYLNISYIVSPGIGMFLVTLFLNIFEIRQS